MRKLYKRHDFKITPPASVVGSNARAHALELANIKSPTNSQLRHFSKIYFGKYSGQSFHWILYHAAGWAISQAVAIICEGTYKQERSILDSNRKLCIDYCLDIPEVKYPYCQNLVDLRYFCLFIAHRYK